MRFGIYERLDLRNKETGEEFVLESLEIKEIPTFRTAYELWLEEQRKKMRKEPEDESI